MIKVSRSPDKYSGPLRGNGIALKVEVIRCISIGLNMNNLNNRKLEHSQREN